jgi:hypothetical protein
LESVDPRIEPDGFAGAVFEARGKGRSVLIFEQDDALETEVCRASCRDSGTQQEKPG